MSNQSPSAPRTPTVTRIVVSVAHTEKARAFYETALGLTVARSAPGFTFLETADGIEVLLHERPSIPSTAGVAVSFGVADVDETTSRAVNAGATVIDAPADQPWGERLAVLRDPDGHVVCLASPSKR